jgi:hypothetical protein
MVKIVNCCHCNLNQSFNQNNFANDLLGEDITNELSISTTPLNIFSAISTNRKIIKIYTINYSDKSTELWLRHGTDININNFTLSLPVHHLYINSSQAAQPLSLVCSFGTAAIKLTTVNKS